MRLGDDLRQLRQPRIDRRFDLEHIQSRPGDVAGLDGRRQRRLVDQLPASRVDDTHARPAAPRPRGVDEVTRFRRRRNVKRYVISSGKEVVELQELDPEPGRSLFGDERIVRDELHAERARLLVLDNCERVLAAAPEITTLLAA